MTIMVVPAMEEQKQQLKKKLRSGEKSRNVKKDTPLGFETFEFFGVISIFEGPLNIEGWKMYR